MSLKDIIKVGQYYKNKYSKLTNVNVEPGSTPSIDSRLKNAKAWQDRLNSVIKNLTYNVSSWIKSDDENKKERQQCLNELSSLNKELNSGSITESSINDWESKVLSINEKIGTLTSNYLKYFPGQYSLMRPPSQSQQFKSLQSILLQYKSTAEQWLKSFPQNKTVQQYNNEIKSVFSKAKTLSPDKIYSELSNIENKYKDSLAALRSATSSQIAKIDNDRLGI